MPTQVEEERMCTSYHPNATKKSQPRFLSLSGLLLIILVSFSSFSSAASVDLTFELPDNAKECFFENIPKNTSCTLEFQVVAGGAYDVDVTVMDPDRVVIYRQVKTQFDSHTFTSSSGGEYAFCFSNEFSTFSHKLVYMDLQVGEEEPLPGLEHPSVMTQMELSADVIRKTLISLSDQQVHHKLSEAQDRKRAEELNERVFRWSLIETICVLTIGIGQVFILKNFFSEKRPYQPLRN